MRRFALTALLFGITLTLVLVSTYTQQQAASLRPGQASPQTYVAPQSLMAMDEVATAQARQTARLQVPVILSAVPGAKEMMLDKITSSSLPSATINYLTATYRQAPGVSPAELPKIIRRSVLSAPAAARADLRSTLGTMLIASAENNPTLTEAAREAAAHSVPPVLRSLSAGETIVAEGAPLTANTISVLESAGLYNSRGEEIERGIKLWFICTLLALVLTLPLLFFYYLLRETTTVGQLSFLVALWASAMVIQRFMLLVDTYLVIIAFLPLVGAVLFGHRAAFALGVWLSAMTGLLTPGSGFSVFLVGLSASIVALFSARLFKTRATLLLAGVLGGLGALIAYSLYSALNGGFGTPSMLASAAWILLSGVFVGILALATLPIAESNMGFLTEFRLLELMSPANPLLQKLLLEAPGTYQHSLIISNLVDQAVANIGGNALLARVGALYHDVGKLKRPQFFTENQFAGENPHDRTSPHLSYLIITNHVRDGVELLREYGLPKALEPFVMEHHGTTVLAYFYKRALETSDSIVELNFRYAGPRPQSKETAVLMLADAVESASRTLEEPTQGSIRAMIDRLFEQRLQDDQLAESPLNFHDMEVIANTFERMLVAILHRRVHYPSKEEIQRLKSDRDTRRNLSLPA